MDKLYGLPAWKLILIAFLVQKFLMVIFDLILPLIGISLPEIEPPYGNVKEEFIAVLIFSPVVETILCQEILMNITNKINQWLFKRKLIAVSIIISATLFGLGHDYPPVYIFTSFISGVILSTFHVIMKKKTKSYAWFFTAILHSLFNLTIFIERNVLPDY